MANQTKQDSVDFESEINKLETIIAQMESGQLSLEDTLKHYETGINMVTRCQSALKAAEQKVQLLTEETEQMSLTDFTQDGKHDNETH